MKDLEKLTKEQAIAMLEAISSILNTYYGEKNAAIQNEQIGNLFFDDEFPILKSLN